MTVIRAGIVWAALFLVSAFVLSTSEYGEKYELRTVDVALLVSWAATATIAWINWSLELRRYKRFQQLFLSFPTGLFRKQVEEHLCRLAKRVRLAAEDLLILQHRGLTGFGYEWKNYGYDEVNQRLANKFSRCQKDFYDAYDEVSSVEELAGLVLGERSWKKFAGEPEFIVEQKVV
ncbi:MAG: hypothetical protein NUV78_00385 [Candidatus Zambryskibacteria bacterium]|nr:hypothetical protein [Candidatus Zambryskibacteria bacterium]